MNLKDELTELENLVGRLNQRRVKELISPPEKPNSLLGNNGAVFLAKILERSHDLLVDCVDASKRHRILSLYILTRAHYETTANLLYFLNKIENYYKKKITLEDVERALQKLSIGSKLKFDDGGPEMPDPVHVLTTIEVADKYLRSAGSEVDMFARGYSFISEIAHPNHLGISYRSKTHVETGSILFQDDREAYERLEKSAINKLLISASIFNHYYDCALELLSANETMPTLVKWQS